MEKFTDYISVVVPVDRSNIDTDAIIPKQFLKSVEKSGFGDNLFDEWRYLDQGEPGESCEGRPINKEFILNKIPYSNGKILLSRSNFGCGSSREHAVWALRDFGIRTVLAESFADIFFNNCFKNGVLPIILSPDQIDELFKMDECRGPFQMEVSLTNQTLSVEDAEYLKFEVDAFKKKCLLEGLDDIDLTLRYSQEISAYEKRRMIETPWLFKDLV